MAFDRADQVRPQFLSVPGLQSLRVEALRPHKVSNILTVARHIPAELRENQIVRIEDKEAELFEACGEEFGHPLFVIFRKGSDCGVMHIDFVFSTQARTLACDSFQFFRAAPRNERLIIQIVCASRKFVGGDRGKAADTVKPARLA